MCLRYVPGDRTLACRETLHVELKDAQGRSTARRSLDRVDPRLLVGCARLYRDPAHSDHGFGQQVASLVLWFGFDDWVTDQIYREATRTLTPSS